MTAGGAIATLGTGVEPLWAALVAGRSGLAPVTQFDPSRYAARQAAEVRDVPADPLGEVGERAHRLALAAAGEAVLGIDGAFTGERAAIVAGTTLGGNLAYTGWLDGAGDGSHASLAAVTNLLAARLGVRGPTRTVSVACASGTAAIGLGAQLIERGEADVVLAGGYDALSEFVFAGFDSLRALSVSTVRPFDARRDGLGLGEGAAFLLLEEAEHAARRGARPLALVSGYASSSDAHHMTRPSPSGDGLVRALTAALARAGAAPEDVGFVSAHGTGTTFNDRMEAAAFRRVFGERTGEIPVNSIKSGLGHTLGAAGALEALMTVLVLDRGLVPPTPLTETLDPACTLDVVRGSARPVAGLRLAVSTSSAFAGTNAALVLEKA